MQASVPEDSGTVAFGSTQRVFPTQPLLSAAVSGVAAGPAALRVVIEETARWDSKGSCLWLGVRCRGLPPYLDVFDSFFDPAVPTAILRRCAQTSAGCAHSRTSGVSDRRALGLVPLRAQAILPMGEGCVCDCVSFGTLGILIKRRQLGGCRSAVGMKSLQPHATSIGADVAIKKQTLCRQRLRQDSSARVNRPIRRRLRTPPMGRLQVVGGFRAGGRRS
jgi:hypothetical protein